MGLYDRDYMREKREPAEESDWKPEARMQRRDWILLAIIVSLLGGSFAWTHRGKYWAVEKKPILEESESVVPVVSPTAASMSQTETQNAQVTPPPARNVRFINLNTATAQQLALLPRIGPKFAKLIIAHRPYEHERELLKVPRFSQSMLDDVLPYITVEDAQ